MAETTNEVRHSRPCKRPQGAESVGNPSPDKHEARSVLGRMRMNSQNLRSPISPTVDFDRDGVQHGFLRLPYSRDDSAWGSVMIPICVIRNGTGQTALLTGGNHGDEYEGPLALYDLART